MRKSFDILNSFVDSIAIIDSSGKIIFTNDGWKQFAKNNSGTLIKTDLGVNYLSVCKSSNALSALDGISKVIAAELEVFELEYPCHSNTEKRWFILRALPLKNSPYLFLLSHFNVTKRKKSEEIIEERNHQLSEINSRLNTAMFKIVHDIQAPLNSIEGLINLSKIDKKSHSTELYFSLMEKSILNLKEFVIETLKLSSSNRNNESIQFKKILDQFYESIKYSEILKKVEIKFSVVQNAEFYTNKMEVLSVLSNTINNSIKYYDSTKEKPFVSVSITANEMDANIFIKDNGIGIDQQDLAKIFDLSFQVNKNSEAGAGIGLNLVKKSLEIIKGQLQVFSKLGEGTEIKITFPNNATIGS